MANYTFTKEAKLFLVYGAVKYRVDINAISFSQSFQEKSYKVKTLHNQVGFEGSSINRANPAEFSFNTPLLEEKRHEVVFNRLLDYATFDLYISSGQDVYKLDKCVIQDGTFEINKSRPLRLSVTGEASKLSKLSAEEIVTLGNITLYTGGTSTTTYIVPRITSLLLGGIDISSDVTALGVEIQNDLDWDKFETLQGAVSATNAATSMFPNSITPGTRVVAGSISKHLSSTAGIIHSPNLLSWSTDTPLVLKAGVGVGAAFRGVSFNFTNCSFTNRFQDGEVFMEEYSWRLTQRDTALAGLITYTTNT